MKLSRRLPNKFNRWQVWNDNYDEYGQARPPAHRLTEPWAATHNAQRERFRTAPEAIRYAHKMTNSRGVNQ